jgi:hypothetical protein
MAEAFNSLLKGELIHNPIASGRGWQSIRDVEIAVAEYVDCITIAASTASLASALRPRSKPPTERQAAINPLSPPGPDHRQRDLHQTRGASMLSAPTAMPAMIAVSLPAGFAPAEATSVAVNATLSETRADCRHAQPGPSPAPGPRTTRGVLVEQRGGLGPGVR